MTDCCQTDRCQPNSPDAAICGECGTRGLAVDQQTMDALLTPDARRKIADARYYFDTNPDCRVVYFSNTAGSRFYTDDLRVRVGLKERDDPVPICYCFDHTRASITEEVQATGESNAFRVITKKVQAGECACEVRNPSGRCCLGDVSRAIRTAQVELEAVRQA